MLNDPFRYIPHPLVSLAAHQVLSRIVSSPTLNTAFEEGKMLGVLIVRLPEQPVPGVHTLQDRIGYICGFSGTVHMNGMSTCYVEGFAPAVIDLTRPDGYFRKEEARITEINQRLCNLESSQKYQEIKREKEFRIALMNKELEQEKSRILELKKQRDRLRSECYDSSIIERLNLESQHQKAVFRRLKESHRRSIHEIGSKLESFEAEIRRLRQLRAQMSETLQEWIFRSAIVTNASGEKLSIKDIFASEGLVPPGGTGDCAGPKMLNHAFSHGLTPLYMGEFWCGKSPEGPVRNHGHFYPSCTSKCGPLLKWMLEGPDSGTYTDEDVFQPAIIYEDDHILAVDKPSGMPSVPGLDGRKSLEEHLKQLYPEIHTVHRLDMDTCGIIIFAKNTEAAASLRKQFEERKISKTYMARLAAPSEESQHILTRDEGSISFPISPDYEDRPRQKCDFVNGKEAITHFRVRKRNHDGTIDITLNPVTGRTHQLRVHCAHSLGLGLPIAGDMLYGGACHDRHTFLHLQAHSIKFRHPASGVDCILDAAIPPTWENQP